MKRRMIQNDIRIRRADLKDLDSLIEFRIALFREMGIIKLYSDERPFYNAVKQYFNTYIPKESFLSWIAEKNGEIIASSGLIFIQKPPSPNNLSGKEAYIMNLYTAPEWRGRGIATSIMRKIFEFIEENEIDKASLHATDIGQSIYDKLGFQYSNNEMILQEKH
jgi:ribosomal protein S18 acetylase RimI-like enzyme